MITNNYGIPCNSISAKSLQANTIVKRVHQSIGSITRTFQIQQIDLKD